MPSNLLKIYNKHLEMLYGSMAQNIASLRAVFNRDFSGANFLFKDHPIKPTTAENGEDSMDRLFRHLTTVIVDQATKHREFEVERSIRIHWIKHLIMNWHNNNIVIFKIPDENRIYLLDKNEKYVIVFEPLRNGTAVFLLTAYKLEPSRYKNLMRKYEKRGQMY